MRSPRASSRKNGRMVALTSSSSENGAGIGPAPFLDPNLYPGGRRRLAATRTQTLTTPWPTSPNP
jgi:hypothetical protein